MVLSGQHPSGSNPSACGPENPDHLLRTFHVKVQPVLPGFIRQSPHRLVSLLPKPKRQNPPGDPEKHQGQRDLPDPLVSTPQSHHHCEQPREGDKNRQVVRQQVEMGRVQTEGNFRSILGVGFRGGKGWLYERCNGQRGEDDWFHDESLTPRRIETLGKVHEWRLLATAVAVFSKSNECRVAHKAIE